MFDAEIKYQPEKGGVYLGSPSIIRLSERVLVASHDYFGKLRDPDGENGLTSIYRSEDNGATWVCVTHLIKAFWGTLFRRGEELYHLSCSREYGDILIRRSRDGGFSWTLPHDENTGLLRRAGAGLAQPNYHFGGATPVLFHQGRIYKAVENLATHAGGTRWEAGLFRAQLMSAPIDADWLRSDNWTLSAELSFDPETMAPGLSAPPNSGWLEGSPLVRPDGELGLLLRIHLTEPNHAALLRVSPDGQKLVFDRLIDFIGGHSKTTIRFDAVTRRYYTLTNRVTREFPTARNVLVLASSPNLIDWREDRLVMDDDTGLEPELSARLTGFQYADWQFDGDDLIAAVRVGYRGAHNFHDSNRIIFRRIARFRQPE